jgi:hypothetical protein
MMLREVDAKTASIEVRHPERFEIRANLRKADGEKGMCRTKAIQRCLEVSNLTLHQAQLISRRGESNSIISSFATLVQFG